MDKSRLDTSKGLLYKPTKSPQPQFTDSFEIIKRNRNEIVDKSTLVTQSEQAARYQSPLVPRLIHLTAIDPKRRQRVQSTVNHIPKARSNKSLSIKPSTTYSRDLSKKFQVNYEEDKTPTRLQRRWEDQREFGFSEGKGRRGKSFDCIKRSELGRVVADIKRRRRNEQHIDQMLDQIIAGDVFGGERYEGRRKQIISTIPTGLNFPTPRYANIPSPMTGRFNIPEEDKVNTIKIEQLPTITVDNISQLPDIELQSNQSVNIARKKVCLY